MVIYAWIWVVISIADFGVWLCSEEPKFNPLFDTIIVLPLIGRVLGWW